jgi:hypothetical protein
MFFPEDLSGMPPELAELKVQF